MTDAWTKLNDHELRFPPNIIRMVKDKIGCVRRAHWGINSYTVLVGKPVGNRSLGRPMSIWKNSVKIDLQ